MENPPVEKIIVPFPDELYENYISRILESRENKKNEEYYQERHHIKPKCMEGTNDEDNLIYLYAQEHYYAHKLLAQENPDNNKLTVSWWCMAHMKNPEGNRVILISAEDFAELRKAYSELMRNKMSGENNPMYGKTGELSSFYGVHRFGKDNPFYGHTHTQETKDKISAKNKGCLTSYKNPSAKAVVCINTGEVFLTVQDAALFGGTNYYGSNIIKCCKGRFATCGKHPETGERLKWRYASEEEKQEKLNSLIYP